MMINVGAQSPGPLASIQGISEGHLNSESLFLCLGVVTVQSEVQSYKEVDLHIIPFVGGASYFMLYFILLNFIFQCPCSVHQGESAACYTVPLIVEMG